MRREAERPAVYSYGPCRLVGGEAGVLEKESEGELVLEFGGGASARPIMTSV